MARWSSKDPDERVYRTIDWSDLLGSDTIVSTTAEVLDGGDIVKDAHAVTDGNNQSTTTWLSGGTAGQTYHVEVTIETAAGETRQRTVEISVRDK